MKYEVKKLFNGYASVRDYIVKRCIDNREPLTIIYQDKKMVLSPSELIRKCEQLYPNTIMSKWIGNYTLFDYRFTPNGEMDLFDK